MRKYIKEKWIKALRSGDYKRAEGELRIIKETKKGKKFESFCCLGVLCDLRKGSEKEWELMDYHYKHLGSGGMPSLEVLNWARLKQEDASKLAEMNDYGTSFNKIADWIEKNL